MSNPLTVFIRNGDVLSIRNYLESGGSFENVTVVDPKGFGRTPLELAAIVEAGGSGSPEVTKLIFEKSNEESKTSALYAFASEDYNINFTKILLKTGVEPDGAIKNRTALQLAVGNGNPKTVYELLRYGADPAKTGQYGSAIEIAEGNSNELYSKMLKSAIEGKVKSPYDFVDLESVKAKLKTWADSIRVFAEQHKDQKFYVFGIDAGELVANSEEAFQKTLSNYLSKYGDRYKDEEKVRGLKYNAGDFSFRIPIVQSDDIKSELDFSFLNPQEDESRIEKELLRDGLIHNRGWIFKELKITEDFKISAFGHIY
ncbi:ankyrin repeat domain-containing protein [Leptospira gomenensis]|uniref:Ankyrin repeat domain-containing protein n=1 Tax=Leptospira gomenensis TaxID=2484974 RepID=A0A5F1YF06_9LEPT|nr:ankyrin repeat domain-containing protein [Leptospira gomenensis]TGK38396.1 ankyrin repeat domain-containing protein [Leptospira gomenensis]TGK39316.1 ankyrin repeat domain-containing protein [Leptospira gomenensis]TGK52210.1 ankyrin repeat domain-containing protein [Leptospira gomenensis]TGK62936.1 ankyrin repeat domain-containing protein [Leptospira gomenensis]